MCFGGWRIPDLGFDLRSPIMCFDFGSLKKIGRGFGRLGFRGFRV